MWDSKRDREISNRLLDSLTEAEAGMIWENSIEPCILHVKCDVYAQQWNCWVSTLFCIVAIPVQVWCMRQGAQDQCAMTTLRQQKRHRCIGQSFGLCGRGRGWDDLGEWHWNMYNIIYEMNRQSRFNAGYRMLGAGALGRPKSINSSMLSFLYSPAFTSIHGHWKNHSLY